jgi:hypothetical protein
LDEAAVEAVAVPGAEFELVDGEAAVVGFELPEALPAPDPEVEVEVEEVLLASTTTVPCMNGWTVQKYVKVPAWVNVCEALWPFFRTPVSKLRLFAVAECGLGPAFVQVIVSPTCTVIVAGANLKSEIVSPGSPAAAALAPAGVAEASRLVVLATRPARSTSL